MAISGENESGVLVYPQLSVPGRRKTEPGPAVEPDPRAPRRRLPRLPRLPRVSLAALATVALAALGGGAIAWLLRPMIAPDPRITSSSSRALAAEAAEAAQRNRTGALERSLEAASRSMRDAEARLAAAQAAQAELAGKTADQARRRSAADAVLARLAPVIDRSITTAFLDGVDVHVRITDRGVFRPGDDALTDRGKAVFGRLASALKELGDRQIWVQGHTDDTPVPLPRPAAPVAAQARGGRPAPPAPAPPVPAIRFATNWELSGARALAVVRYLHDTAKLDPARLVALAFGPYAPISDRDKMLNRRIELVITGKPAGRAAMLSER